MKVTTTPIDGLLIIQPQVFKDERGYFYESFNKENFSKIGINEEFVQDNQSLSQKGIVRGLHFQSPPFAQGKLIRVIQGSVNDVVVDIRKHSKTFGQHFAIELNDENMTMFWIPPGFAHGFETLVDNTIFQYKCTQTYNKQSEGGLFWNDISLDIKWKSEDPIVSEKDKVLSMFNNFISPF